MAFRSGIRNFLLLPSFLCLDAPLVAVGWALLIRNAETHATTPALIPCLFFAVWAIYLADRIHDVTICRQLRSQTLRHQFAANHPDLLSSLLGINLVLGAACSISTLKLSVLAPATPIAIVTLLYFVIFRFPGRNRPSWLRFPGKELVIAFCFSGGVSLAAVGSRWLTDAGAETGALGFLVLTNCLVISRAESRLDRLVDPHAFFAEEPNRAGAWIGASAVAALLCAVCSLPFRPFDFPAATGVSVLLLLVTFHRTREHSTPAQAASDASLLIPWVFLAWRTVSGNG